MIIRNNKKIVAAYNQFGATIKKIVDSNGVVVFEKSSGSWVLDMSGYILGEDGKYYQRWIDTEHSIDNNPVPDLNDQWVVDTISGGLNIDTNFDYYMSNSNYHIANGYSQFKVTWSNLTEIDFLYRSKAESSYDYLVIGGLDQPMFDSMPNSSSAGILAHTQGKQTDTYNTLHIDCDEGEHHIWFCYRKDGSADTEPDRAFVGVPNNYVIVDEKRGAELSYEYIKSSDVEITRPGFGKFKYYKHYYTPDGSKDLPTTDYILGEEEVLTPVTRDYLRFDATDGDLHIGVNDLSLFKELECAVGFEETWMQFPTEGVDVPNGKSLYLRGIGLNAGEHSFTTSKICECHGNIMSLLDKNNFETKLRFWECSFNSLFKNTLIKTAPELPATEYTKQWGGGVYEYMFQNCTELINAPIIHLESWPTNCSQMFYCMFNGCTKLKTTQEVINIIPSNKCCEEMFRDCISLVNAPQLPATTLYSYCYQTMFKGCTSLVNAPELPATTLGDNCYKSMFEGCTSLVNAPQLPATTLYSYCYQTMFKGCTSLVNAPELPATTLKSYCYNGMFSGCTSLVNAPQLPATTLGNSCYTQMFYNCKNLKEIYCNARYNADGSEITTQIASSWLSYTPNTTDCIFHKNPDWAGPTVRGDNTVPSNWQIVDWREEPERTDYFGLVNMDEDSYIYLEKYGTDDLQKTYYYSIDNTTDWQECKFGLTERRINVNSGQTVYFKSDDTANVKILGDKPPYIRIRGVNGVRYMAIGDLTSLYGFSEEIPDYGLYKLLESFEVLSAEQLTISADKIGDYGCNSLFAYSALTYNMNSLPATKLGELAYGSMFYGTTIEKTPILENPDVNHTNQWAYMNMFNRCEGITEAYIMWDDEVFNKVKSGLGHNEYGYYLGDDLNSRTLYRDGDANPSPTWNSKSRIGSLDEYQFASDSWIDMYLIRG